jgi:hypothetical protein
MKMSRNRSNRDQLDLPVSTLTFLVSKLLRDEVLPLREREKQSVAARTQAFEEEVSRSPWWSYATSRAHRGLAHRCQDLLPCIRARHFQLDMVKCKSVLRAPVLLWTLLINHFHLDRQVILEDMHQQRCAGGPQLAGTGSTPKSSHLTPLRCASWSHELASRAEDVTRSLMAIQEEENSESIEKKPGTNPTAQSHC